MKSYSMTVGTTAYHITDTANISGGITADVWGEKVTVTFQADKDNTGVIALGDANVAVGTGAGQKGIELSAGQSYTMKHVHLQDIYARASAAGQILAANVHKPY